jgi:para-aminobenzoate synthetase component I
MYSTRTEIIDRINRFSSRNEAFLFCIDFPGENGFVMTPEEADNKGIRYNINGIKNEDKNAEISMEKFEYFPVGIRTYQNAFDKVIFHLKRGDTYLLNLTFPTPVVTDLALHDIFSISHAPFKIYIPGHLVVFSPEIFVRIEKGIISSFPMKGTIDASVPGARGKLLADKKEEYEHNTIVDLIRNDLSMVATGVKVARFRYIDRIHTHRGDLLAMSSEIAGHLPADYAERLGDILFTLLPAGSVTGAPKEKTVEIIRSAEQYVRGFYTGIFGFFDGRSLTSAVSIRYIEQTDSGLVFKSGGGITALSDMEREYREMISKIYVPVV